MYKELSDKFSVNITASGGVSTIDDIKALRKINIHAAIIGKAYYTGAISLDEAIEVAKWLQKELFHALMLRTAEL